MNYFVTASEIREAFQAAGADLCEDYRLLLELMRQFERADDHSERRDLMRTATDLYEVHAAIERRVGGNATLSAGPQGEALHELMVRQESTDACSRLHYARGLEVKRLLESHVAHKMRRLEDVSSHAKRMQSNAGLWYERVAMMGYARSLIQMH